MNRLLPAPRHLCLQLVICAAMVAATLFGFSTARADNWVGEIAGVGPEAAVQLVLTDSHGPRDLCTVTVTNSGTLPWGDFHFGVFDPTGGSQNISNIDFLDASMGGVDPTSTQAGLTWVINDVVVGATIDLFYCSDPVLPGETASFSVFYVNPDHISFPGILLYPTPVPPSGACCYPNGSCTLVCQHDCLPPAVWHVEWTSCVPNPCPQPLGACCRLDGSCVLIPHADCQPPSVWHEEWTSCEPNLCPPPEGACCDLFGGCVITTEANCPPPGVWFGLNPCIPSPCPPGLGACCFTDGHCEFLNEMQCLTSPDHLLWFASTTCAPINPCPQPGACCDPGTGVCTFVQQGTCPPGWTWTAGVPCLPTNPCPQPGACCNPDTGACTYVQQGACPPGWTWIAGVPCVPTNPCPPPVPTGACCDPQGNCTITTQAGCLPPSVWHPEYVSCVPNFCPPPVPVQNTTWGAIKATYR
jgi:hypothetical protein